MGKKKKIYKFSKSLNNLIPNVEDTRKLLNIYSEKVLKKRTQKEERLLLNSYWVLMTACWESFIEDLASEAFDFLLRECKTSDAFPNKLKSIVTEKLVKDESPLGIWALADSGWRNELESKKKEVLENLNTPSSTNIDEMFFRLLGLRHLSSGWHWHGIAVKGVNERLRSCIKTRGDIAHRVSTSENLTKRKVKNFGYFIYRLSVLSNNTVRIYIYNKTKKYPWGSSKYGSIK